MKHPEGKSIIELSEKLDVKGIVKGELALLTSHFSPAYINFTAETRSSGIDYENTRIRKGATDAIKILLQIRAIYFRQKLNRKSGNLSKRRNTARGFRK